MSWLKQSKKRRNSKLNQRQKLSKKHQIEKSGFLIPRSKNTVLEEAPGITICFTYIISIYLYQVILINKLFTWPIDT
jgi:hypothetical protein